MQNRKNTLLTFILCITFSGIVQAQQTTDTLKVFFAVDESIIDRHNAKVLDALVAKKNIDSIYIYGYTDFLGNALYNQQLSERRSKSVYDYLTDRGVDSKNIAFAVGKGVHPNSTESNHQDPSDIGIQIHRIVQIAYTLKDTTHKKGLSKEDLVPNTNIVLENILFIPGRNEFRPESYPALKELYEVMQSNPTLKIEIQGHICCSDIDDELLSRDRAKAVYNYLIQNGIDPSRLSYDWFGSTRKKYPLERNEEEMAMNRRVEILILENEEYNLQK